MNKKQSNKNDDSDQQPSTSAGFPSVLKNNVKKENDEEMIRLLQATDEILENKAKSMNLSSLNVRSILHHLIKYPSTIDVLLGIRENDDLPSVRNTRSRRKPDDSGASSTVNTPKKFALRIEDKGPKSFLDLEYEEDDEFDDDYVEEGQKSPKDGVEVDESEDDENDDEDEEDEEDEEENIEEEEIEQAESFENPEHISNVQNDTLHNILFGENMQDNNTLNMTLNDTRAESVAPVPTLDNVVDDDDYRNFVISLQCPSDDFDQKTYDTEDDAEDEDYNVIADNLNVDDRDEIRQDKTTMIPRHEVKGLVMDTLLAEKEIPINVLPEEAIQREEIRKSQKEKDAEVWERLNVSVTSSSESCSLLKGNVTFRPQEVEQLRTQLEQHVQLLTQFVVTCHHDTELAHVRNTAQLMMNELDDIRNQRPTSIFEVQNLDAAIESCHDINSFESVSPNIINWSQDTDGHGGLALRPEAAAVLSRSRAIRFPALLPPVQPAFIERPISFLQHEDVMLAVALLQFAHLPRRAEKDLMDRYTAIHQNCLPARTAYKIRNHLKSMRRNVTNPSPIHQIIQAAEQGICSVTLPSKSWDVLPGPIDSWPTTCQPVWYQQFRKIFNVTEDRKIHLKNERTMILTPVKHNAASKNTQSSSANNDQILDDNEEFVEVGTGPSGQTVVMDREHIQELIMSLIRENETSPSKRRKNPTPMKLSTMMQLSDAVTEEHGKTQSQGLVNQIKSEPSTSVRKVGNTKVVKPTLPKERSVFPKKSCDAKNFNASLSTSTPLLANRSESPCGAGHRRSPSIPPERKKPSRRKGPTVQEVAPIAANNFDVDCNTCSSFPIPPTPGRRSPDEYDDIFMDLESNSLLWNRTPHSVVTQGNPLTPRCFSSECTEPVDFSSMASTSTDEVMISMTYSCQKPMGYSSEIPEFSNSSDYQEEIEEISTGQRHISESTVEDETSMTGLDIVPLDDEEEAEECAIEEDGIPAKMNLVNSRPPLRAKRAMASGDLNVKASRKRTRLERETMGAVGLDDVELHSQQKIAVMRKVLEDVNQRLFMHKDTWQRFKRVMTDNKLSDAEKVPRITLILANHPELLNLVLLYAPSEALLSDFHSNPHYQSYKEAIDMILDIERYISAAKLKEPSLRSLFRYIRSFLESNKDMSGEQAASHFFQLFGQDRPLWKRLESKFWCLPFKKKPTLESFEYVDLTGIEKTMTKKERKEKNNIPSRFELIDDIDQVMGTSYRPPKSEQHEKESLVVKCGEFCIRNEQEDTYTQLEITERHWTRKDDITLLTRYNEATNWDPNLSEDKIPSLVPDLQFGDKSIIARLQYLLTELKSLE